MAPATPYTYIQCPCSDPAALTHPNAVPLSPTQLSHNDDERTFDPRAPRSNYSLYPLEYLLYCEDCHQIRCPRCIAEEIVTYYCPNCLFEVPSSNLKSEGNRCTRNCFQCPICVGPLTVSALETPAPPSTHLAADSATGASAAQAGPYILTCNYCAWSSPEIGIKFDKPSGIYGQLSKLRNGGKPKHSHKNRGQGSASHRTTAASGLATSGLAPSPTLSSPASPLFDDETPDPEGHFAALKSFYQTQLSESTGSTALSALTELGFNSPGSLTRMLSLYAGGGSGGAGILGDKRSKAGSKPDQMREASSPSEGLLPAHLDESAAIARLRTTPWDGTSSTLQNEAQASAGAGACPVPFTGELRPTAHLLRTKRSKRCPVCRHIISKPEQKISNTRFRIRLVAGSYIPSISIKPMWSLNQPMPPATQQPVRPPPTVLTPLKPTQFLLTFHNPIFEAVKVTLATPAVTPGRFQSKVTVLCPQFEIDANTDVWEDALKDSSTVPGSRQGSVSATRPRAGTAVGEEGQNQAEAGKIWERGRNWVTIVLEVVPSSVRVEHLSSLGKEDGEVDTSPLKEDEDVLEIPMFVRLEWEVDTAQEEVGHDIGREKDAKDKREMAYWCVLGIGRISQEL